MNASSARSTLASSEPERLRFACPGDSLGNSFQDSRPGPGNRCRPRKIGAVEEVRDGARGDQRLEGIADLWFQMRADSFGEFLEMTLEKSAIIPSQRSLTIDAPALLPAPGQTGVMEDLAQAAAHIKLARSIRLLDIRRELGMTESQLDLDGQGKRI